MPELLELRVRNLIGIFCPRGNVGRRLLFRSVSDYPNLEDAIKMVSGKIYRARGGLSSAYNFSSWKKQHNQRPLLG